MIFEKKGGSNRNAHLKNQQSEKSHPFQKLVDVRKQLIDEAEALDDEVIVPADKRSGAARRPEVQRRTESRLERRRDDAAIDESPQYQQQQFNESNMLLQKLMENLKGNPAL